MSMTRVLVRRPVFPSDFRTLFRTLSGLAVASSFGLSGCSVSTPLTDEPDGPSGGSEANLDGSEPASDGAQHTGGSAPPDEVRHSDGGQPVLDAGQLQDASSVALPGPWVPFVCPQEGNEEPAWPFETANLAMPVDYLAKYSVYFDSYTEAGDPIGPPVFGDHVLYGEPCAGATDEAACLSEVDRQLAATECEVEPCVDFMLATAGDQVTRIEERAALTSVLGSVDTEVEAAIATLLADGSVSCWQEIQLDDGGIGESYGTRIRAVEGGYEVQTFASCYGSESTGLTMVGSDGTTTVLSTTAYCLGRRPDGLLPAVHCAARSELGAHFASATHLEAASVFAFEQLARDLTRLGAPSELIACAQRSALEEIGHTRTMGALAVRFGAELAAPQIAPPLARDAFAVALENAVEGCVRETYGALVACYQAQTARDPDVRAAMTQLFEDETRHAELAWKIAQWLEPQLSDAERDALQLARRAAYAQLRSELSPSLSPGAMRQIGLPDAGVGIALLAQLDAALGLAA